MLSYNKNIRIELIYIKFMKNYQYQCCEDKYKLESTQYKGPFYSPLVGRFYN